jgi:hypothetical protein
VRKKLIAIAVSTVAAGAILAGVASAFWTSSGAGEGSASTTSGLEDAVDVHQAAGDLTPMYPGDSAQPLDFTLENTTGQDVYISDVAVAVTDVKKDGESILDGCDATNFTIVQPNPDVVKREVLKNTTSAAISSGSIQFNNKNVNQDACKGASVVLTYTAS